MDTRKTQNKKREQEERKQNKKTYFFIQMENPLFQRAIIGKK